MIGEGRTALINIVIASEYAPYAQWRTVINNEDNPK